MFKLYFKKYFVLVLITLLCFIAMIMSIVFKNIEANNWFFEIVKLYDVIILQCCISLFASIILANLIMFGIFYFYNKENINR